MLMVMDVGNTRTKWAQVQADGSLSVMQVVENDKIATSALKKSLGKADKVVIANVAGDAIKQQILAMVSDRTIVVLPTAQAEACEVINSYDQKETLGIDRWAAVIAAWHMNKQPTIVVNAGTAITIDALSKDNVTKKGVFMGGCILPGLQLMYRSLTNSTAKLATTPAGIVTIFPKNTQDAIQTGCMNAIAGAVVLRMKQLEKHDAFLPKIVISGGDAVKIAEGLKPELKRVIVADNLVLQGLAFLEKEYV